MTRVLVVEDEADILLALRLELEIAGFEVMAASSGEEALELYRTSRPDVVVLDLRLPGIDGLEVLRTIRDLDAAAAPPVIVSSAHASHEHRDQARHLGAVSYLAKPFQIDALRNELARVLAPG